MSLHPADTESQRETALAAGGADAGRRSVLAWAGLGAFSVAASAALAPWLVRRLLPVVDDLGVADPLTLLLGIKLVIEGAAVGCICGLALMLLYGPAARVRFAELDDVRAWRLPLHGVWAGALGWGVGAYVLGLAINAVSSIAAAIVKAILGIPPLWVGWLVAAFLCGLLSFVVAVPFKACEKDNVERMPGASRLMVLGVTAACLGAVLNFVYLRRIMPDGGPLSRDVLVAPVLSRLYMPVGIAAGLLWGTHAAVLRQRGAFKPGAARAHGAVLGVLAFVAACVVAAAFAKQDLVFVVANREAVLRALAKDPGVAARRDGSGRTPLHHAAILCDYEMAGILLAHGADPNARDAWGRSPLHIAAELEFRPMDASISVGTWSSQPPHESVVELLTEAGADVTLADNNGLTPLHMACLRAYKVALIQNAPQIPLLVDSGADINARDNRGNTPLDIARQTDTRGDNAIADYLISRGAVRGEAGSR